MPGNLPKPSGVVNMVFARKKLIIVRLINDRCLSLLLTKFTQSGKLNKNLSKWVALPHLLILLEMHQKSSIRLNEFQVEILGIFKNVLFNKMEPFKDGIKRDSDEAKLTASYINVRRTCAHNFLKWKKRNEKLLTKFAGRVV